MPSEWHTVVAKTNFQATTCDRELFELCPICARAARFVLSGKLTRVLTERVHEFVDVGKSSTQAAAPLKCADCGARLRDQVYADGEPCWHDGPTLLCAGCFRKRHPPDGEGSAEPKEA